MFLHEAFNSAATSIWSHQNENPGPKRIANVGRVIVARRNVWPIVEGLDVRDSRVHQLNVPMLVRAPLLVNSVLLCPL